MKQVNETIDGSIKNIVQMNTLDQSLEYAQMYDALESTPIEFQQKLIQALNSIGDTLGTNPVEMFNVVLCGNQQEDVRKKLYNWWRGFFEILSSCDIPEESKKEYDDKIDALISEITKSGSSVDLSASKEVVSEEYEQASKEDEDKMLKDMKFAISKIGEIANKVQDIINFVNPYCSPLNESFYIESNGNGQYSISDVEINPDLYEKLCEMITKSISTNYDSNSFFEDDHITIPYDENGNGIDNLNVILSEFGLCINVDEESLSDKHNSRDSVDPSSVDIEVLVCDRQKLDSVIDSLNKNVNERFDMNNKTFGTEKQIYRDYVFGYISEQDAVSSIMDAFDMPSDIADDRVYNWFGTMADFNELIENIKNGTKDWTDLRDFIVDEELYDEKHEDVGELVNSILEKYDISRSVSESSEKTLYELRNEEVDVTYYVPDDIREPGEKPWFTDRLKLKDISYWYIGHFKRVNVDVDGESIRVFRTSSPGGYDYFKFDNPEDEEKFLEYSDILDEKDRRKFDAISERQNMNKTINENDEDENIIDSPEEDGQYLIDMDSDENDNEVFAVSFKKNDEPDDWEYQCTFDTREEALAWIEEERSNAGAKGNPWKDIPGEHDLFAMDIGVANGKDMTTKWKKNKYDEKSSGEWVSIDSLINEDDTNLNEKNKIWNKEEHTIESPLENGQYLIEPGWDDQWDEHEVFNVSFKNNSEDEWEYQCTFDTIEEALAWIENEKDSVAEQFRNRIDESSGSLEQLAHKYQAKIGEALGVLKNFQDESSKYAPTCEHELVTAIENLEVVKEWVDVGVEQGFDGVDFEDVDESEDQDDELKNASPKKFKNDKGSTSELVTGCSKKQVSEMTIQQEIDDPSELLNLLWGQGRDNLRELRDSGVVSNEFLMSMIQDMMGTEEPPTLTAINDLFAYDFESILEPLGIDVEHYRDTLEIVKKNDSVELESTNK